MQTKIVRFIVLAFLILTGFINGQDSDQSSVLITTSSVTQIPADAIYFSITLSAESEDPKKAFENHKTLEKNLLTLIKEFDFADSSISYSLLHIRKSSPYSKEKPAFQTRQVVSINTNDFSKYEPMQIAILSMGIYEYSAKFIAEGKEAWLEKGIREAIDKATVEAELTAKNLGKKLGGILSIESNLYYPSESDGIAALTTMQPGESLIDLPRYVQMRVSLRVRFELL